MLALAASACQSDKGSSQGVQLGEAYSNSTTTQPLIYSGGLDFGYLSGSAARVETIDEDTAILDLVNQARCAAGLVPLAINDPLTQAAAYHSLQMGSQNFFDHISPDGNTPEDRLAGAGYAWSWLGESISGGFDNVEQTYNQWWNSDQNKANLLSPKYYEMGLGHAFVPGSAFQHYWTLVLAAPWDARERPAPPACPN